MKSLLFFLTFISSFIANAAVLNLGCVTEIPTTSMIAETYNGVVDFQLIHHNGVKFMPIYNGVVTPNDLGTLSDRASLLADLGDYLQFKMPSEVCQVNGVLFNCFGSSPKEMIGGHIVRLWAAYSSQYDEESFAGVFSYITTNLAIEVDGQSIYLPMKYSQSECYKDFSKNKNLKKLIR